MTERKPAQASWRSWIDHQIERGREDGAFDDLEGHGRPIRDLDRPHDDLWWVKAKLEREDVVVTPPSLAIRVRRDTVLSAVRTAASEREVREMIETLNDEIRDLNRRVSWGPPTSVAPLDVEEVVAQWRADRPLVPPPSVPHDGPVDDEAIEGAGRRRWFRRRRRSVGDQTP